MRRLLLWLLMVVLMVAAILGGTAAFLYSRKGEADLPQEEITFGGTALEPNGWDWTIPVLGDKVSKTYQSPSTLTVQKLGTFSDTTPLLVLPEWVTSADITVTAPDGSVWNADAETCNTYTYTQNGDYQITVTARHYDADSPGDAVGEYFYRAGYTMSLTPQVTLSSERVGQGGVAAILLTGILDGEPTLETDLGTVWFRETASGYMGYIPVTYNAEGGDHVMTLTCGSLTCEVTLTVTQTARDTVTVEADEETGGAEEFRNTIWPLYTTSGTEKLWSGAFLAPCAGTLIQSYGNIRMVDGARDGQNTGLTYRAGSGESITAPQAGTVVYAGYLQLTGGTVVIDHGCGVKSYLYGITNVTAALGDTVARGDTVGTAGEDCELIYELRIGSKSVDPQPALQGRSGLQYRETE